MMKTDPGDGGPQFQSKQYKKASLFTPAPKKVSEKGVAGLEISYSSIPKYGKEAPMST